MSDDDSAGLPRTKTLTFTQQERKLLLTLVNNHYDVVSNKKVDSKSTNLKYQAWEAIHNEFSQSKIAVYPRTSQQLKRCWENLRCKAKKGDRLAQRLLRWAEKQHKLSKNSGDDAVNRREANDMPESVLERDSDSSVDDNIIGCNNDIKDVSDSLDESLQQLEDSLTDETSHRSGVDKRERLSRVKLLKLEKYQKDRLFSMKMQKMKAKEKREKELHRLAVHEMSLKVENERRRAEILERELGR